MRARALSACCACTLIALGLPAQTRAQSAATPASAETTAEAPPASVAPAPQPYSLPWQLRPAAAANVVRLDSSIAFHDNGASSAYLLLGSYRILPELSAMVRVGIAQNAPDEGEGAVTFVNPAVGATYVLALPQSMRLAFFLGVVLPLGMGGGDTPEPQMAAARSSGFLTRANLDNAMFAVNDLTFMPGVDLAWVAGGFTVQAEVTFFELLRVRGSEVQPDEAKSNLTMGLHVGYFVIPQLSFGAEIRHQRWLTTPAAVEANEALRDTTSFAAGARAHIHLDGDMWLRPGVAFAMGIDDPMADLGYRIVQIDVPFSF